MGVLDFRDAYEFDPETYAGEGGGLPGRLRRYAQQNGIDLGPTPGGPGEYNSDSFASPQGGLIGRLSALQAQQSQYNPGVGNGGQAPFAPQNPNFTQAPETARPVEDSSPYHPETSTAEDGGPLGRLSRYAEQYGIDLQPPDPIDIAKSAGIGVVNGAVGLLGGIPQASDWAHSTVNRGLDMVFNAVSGPPKPSPPPPNINAGASPESIKKFVEGFTGKFYQPTSTVGRYAETIGEMAPAALGSGVGALGQSLARGETVGALRELGGKLMADAVLPGTAVQALDEAFPDSPAAQWVKKAWPWVRRGLPYAPLALETAKRTFRAADSP